MRLYLDNAATTKIHPYVIQQMWPFVESQFGNSNSLYYEEAEVSKRAVLKSRQEVANLIGCKESEVVFTSSGTEANNTILKGLFYSIPQKRKIITTKVEHSSIVETISFLEKQGAKVEYVKIDDNGNIDLKHFKTLLDENTLLVSIMYVNNELGNIFDIESIGKICKEHNVFFHSDFTQAVGKINFSFNEIEGLNSITFSSHKINGPKGIGALIIDEHNRKILTPLIHGGEQEDGLRGGTHAVANIVGFGAACKITHENINENIRILKKQEQLLIDRLSATFGSKLIINNLKYKKVPGIVNFQISGVNNQVFLKMISPMISASSGSACSTSKPSHVLKAMGYTDLEISQSVRFSLSPYDDYEDFKIIE